MKFRGIDIAVVSQFDIRRLPEFAARTTPAFDPTVAVCFIPIYFGSQIWFEYTIDGPHPAEAAYFFKLSINNQAITSWDCTANSGYHGKTTYSLHHAASGREGLCKRIQRSAFKFSNLKDNHHDSVVMDGDDCIQLKIHRIQHRQRIRSAYNITDTAQLSQGYEGKLCLINGGILEPGLPQRRYKYQLLDPVDKPYANFCFYYRTYEWLKENDYLSTTWADESFASSPSPANTDEQPSPVQEGLKREEDIKIEGEPSCSSPFADLRGFSNTSFEKISIQPTSQSPSDKQHSYNQEDHETYLPLSSSEESLSIITKDSIEDLQSHASRSPQSPRKDVYSLRGGNQSHDSLPGLSQSPRRRLKKALTLNLSRDDARHSRDTGRRPLSPFNGGGLLRNVRNLSTAPVSAPAAVTEFGPSVEDEIMQSTQVGSKVAKASPPCRRTTRATRKGLSLMTFLGHRTVRETSNQK